MPILNLLYADSISIDDHFRLAIPTVGEIIDNEEDYYTIVSICTAMPIDYMVMLDELGFDFTEVSEYELFLMLFPCIQDICKKSKAKSDLFLRDTDISKFVLAKDEKSGEYVFIDTESEAVINRRFQSKLASIVRNIHKIKKDNRKPANSDAKEYMLDIARRRARRKSTRVERSHLESLIVALVNAKEFKYDFQSVRNLTIYQFNESVRQVIKRVDYDNYMYGICSGNLRAKDLDKDALNWLSHK